MAERIAPSRFHETAGVEDWRVLAFGACAFFRADSLAGAVRLVEAIGRLADAGDRRPDVDVRALGVTVRLMDYEALGVTEADVSLARQISAAARELGLAADPSQLRDVELTIDAVDIPAVRRFWCAVLGYEEFGEEDALDPHRRWPGIWFQPMDPARTERNRVHVDLFVPPDLVEARVAAAVAAGGRIVRDSGAPTWWTIADPEGNEMDVTSTIGRD